MEIDKNYLVNTKELIFKEFYGGMSVARIIREYKDIYEVSDKEACEYVYGILKDYALKY